MKEKLIWEFDGGEFDWSKRGWIWVFLASVWVEILAYQFSGRVSFSLFWWFSHFFSSLRWETVINCAKVNHKRGVKFNKWPWCWERFTLLPHILYFVGFWKFYITTHQLLCYYILLHLLILASCFLDRHI